MKTHEVQAALSIHLEDGSIDFERRRLRTSLSDLLGPIVEEHLNGIIELIHPTAKEYFEQQILKYSLLIFTSYLEQYHSGHFIDSMDAEFTMARLCLAYLTSEPFEIDMEDDRIREVIFRGDYSFQDYATCNWLHHAGYVESRRIKLGDQQPTSLNILLSELYARHTGTATSIDTTRTPEKSDMQTKLKQLQAMYDLQDRICYKESHKGKSMTMPS